MNTPRKILDLLSSHDPSVQVSALQFLWRNPEIVIGSTPILDMLQKMTRHSDISVKFWAQKVRNKLISKSIALININSENFNNLSSEKSYNTEKDEVILNKLSSGRQPITLDFLKKVFTLKNPATVTHLVTLLDSLDNVYLISYIVKNLGIVFPSEELVPIIAKYLKHSDDRVAANAIEGLAGINSPQSVAMIAEMVSHKNHRVRANAVIALAQHDEKTSQQVLHQMLQMHDCPNFVISACYAARELRAIQFLNDLVVLLKDPNCSEDALKTIGFLCANKAVDFLENYGTKLDLATKEKILFSIQNHLSQKSKSFINPWSKLNSKLEGNFFIEVGEQNIFVLKRKISMSEAEKIAEKEKISSFGILRQFIFRPSENEIKLIYSELRYEPFWHVFCRARVDFTRTRKIEIEADHGVIEMRIGDRIFATKSGKFIIDACEHCIQEKTIEAFFDGQTGDRIDYSKFIKFPKTIIKDPDKLEEDKAIIIPVRIKASIIIRDILVELLQPIKADEINSEKINVETLNLFFRPVYAFEFFWKSQEKSAVLQVDGLTGDITVGKTIKQKFDTVLCEDLFEIGSEAAGFIIPGGEIALKLAKALLRNKPQTTRQ